MPSSHLYILFGEIPIQIIVPLGGWVELPGYPWGAHWPPDHRPLPGSRRVEMLIQGWRGSAAGVPRIRTPPHSIPTSLHPGAPHGWGTWQCSKSEDLWTSLNHNIIICNTGTIIFSRGFFQREKMGEKVLAFCFLSSFVDIFPLLVSVLQNISLITSIKDTWLLKSWKKNPNYLPLYKLSYLFFNCGIVGVFRFCTLDLSDHDLHVFSPNTWWFFTFLVVHFEDQIFKLWCSSVSLFFFGCLCFRHL